MEHLDDNALGIYTDGSSYHGPRRGGIGVLFVTVDEHGQELVIEEPRPGYAGESSNLMELQAVIEALKLALGRRPPVDPATYRKITVFTDSQYVSENFPTAKFQWSSNAWVKRSGGPVENAQFWKELVRLARRADQLGKWVEIKWVKGHGKSKLNKRADKLAKASARAGSSLRLTHTRLRRKKSKLPTEVGSSKMEGQRITIRVISDDYLPVQRLNKYRYEVMSKKSRYYRRVDFIYSDRAISLDRGHTYYVRFNEDTANPRIVKCFREVEAK